jgi:hypothetical protein
MDVKEVSRVKGFLIPEFTETLRDGRTLNGLTSEGFKMVMAGYACGECLAMFDRYTLVCPVCGSWHNPEQVVPAPQLWLDHLAERYADEPYEKPAVVNPFDAIQQVMENPEVEKIPLQKLREKKRRKMH